MALASSVKDLHEHALVRDAVRAALLPYCRELDVPPTPSVVGTPTLWHLSTSISGHLADPRVSALELGLALHPTPAVCGTPTLAARAFIGAAEPVDRAYYAGLVGWCDSTGDGEWAVTLRCAEVEDRSLSLFAGAGIVDGSNPEAELAETSAKFGTFLAALGVGEHPLDTPRPDPRPESAYLRTTP